MHHMLDCILVFLRLKLLIFLFEFLRVFALVAHTSFVRLLCVL